MSSEFSEHFDQAIPTKEWSLLSKDMSRLHVKYPKHPVANEFQYRVDKNLRDGVEFTHGRILLREILPAFGLEDTPVEEQLVMVND